MYTELAVALKRDLFFIMLQVMGKVWSMGCLPGESRLHCGKRSSLQTFIGHQLLTSLSTKGKINIVK